MYHVREADCENLYPLRGHGEKPELSILVSRTREIEKGQAFKRLRSIGLGKNKLLSRLMLEMDLLREVAVGLGLCLFPRTIVLAHNLVDLEGVDK